MVSNNPILYGHRCMETSLVRKQYISPTQFLLNECYLHHERTYEKHRVSPFYGKMLCCQIVENVIYKKEHTFIHDFNYIN